MRPASNFACSTGARDRRCAGRARRPIASSMPRPCSRRSRRPQISRSIEGEVDDLVGEDRAGGVRLVDGREIQRRRRGADHRDIPAGLDPYRRAANSGRPGRRGARAWPIPLAGASGLSRSDASRPERRRGSMATTIDWGAVEMQPGDDPPEPFSVLTERIRQSPNPMRDYAHGAGDPRCRPGQCASIADVFGADQEPRTALLPVDRRQDRAFRRARRPSDFPRAGGSGRHHGLPERHFDLAAGRGSGRARRHHPGPGAGAHHSARLCDRIRPRRSARADAVPGNQTPAGAYSSPDRSTAPPATKKRPPRAWSPDSMRRRARATLCRSRSIARKPISA